ncbi:MAG: hypothetical protein V2B19_16220 [Pseudomonadota bacterium]
MWNKTLGLIVKNGLDHRFGQFPMTGRPRQGVFGRAAGCLSDSEFLTVWKKYPGVADTMIKASKTDGDYRYEGPLEQILGTIVQTER